MKHQLFTFDGKWQLLKCEEHPIARAHSALEAFQVSVPGDYASVIILRSEKSQGDWLVIYMEGTTPRRYTHRPEYVEAKCLAEKVMVGFSLLGDRGVTMLFLEPRS